MVPILLSALVPGSMQWLVGNRRLGRVALITWVSALGVLLLLGLIALVAPGAVVGFLITPWVAAVSRTLIWMLFIGWVLLLIDAWRLADPTSMDRAHRLGMTIGVTVLATVVGVGTAFGASAFTAAGNVGEALPGGGDAATKSGRINVLLLGLDAANDRIGVRPDSITVASIHEETGQTLLFGLPRNMEKVPFPKDSPMWEEYPNGFSCEDHSCMLNAVWTEGEKYASKFPEGVNAGLQATKDAVSATLGLEINYYALVDMKGFSSIVDAMGGITMDIRKDVPIGGGSSPILGYIKAGTDVHLDGYHALWFARSREGSNDYERMQRQKCVVNAMAKQLDPMTVATRFVELSAAGKDLLQTDVAREDLVDLVGLALKAKDLPIKSVNFSPPLVPHTSNPDFAHIRKVVADTIEAAESGKDTQVAQQTEQKSNSASKDSGKTPAPNAYSSDTQGADLESICSAG